MKVLLNIGSLFFGGIQFLAIVGLIIFGIIKIIQLMKKNNLLKNKKALFVSIACIIIATASLVLNMGWLRFGMIFMLIPVIQPILFLVINLYASQFFAESRILRITNILFIVTYLIFWILLPDFGDMGPTYCLFNLVRNDAFTSMAFVVSGIAGITHIVFCVLQIIQFVKIKKQGQ